MSKKETTEVPENGAKSIKFVEGEPIQTEGGEVPCLRIEYWNGVEWQNVNTVLSSEVSELIDELAKFDGIGDD